MMTDKPPRKPRGFERGGKAFKSMPSGIPAMGEGLHGPASGKPPEAFTADNQPSPEAKLAGVDVAREVRERIAAKRFPIVDRLIDTAINGSETASNQAGMYLVNQIAGTATANVDVTSKGERTGYVIAAPIEAETADEWATQHKPR